MGRSFLLILSLYNKVLLCGIKFKVLNKINLLFITCKSTFPLGIDFDKYEFKRRLEEEIKFPVIDERRWKMEFIDNNSINRLNF